MFSVNNFLSVLKNKSLAAFSIITIFYVLSRLPILWQIPLFEDETFHTQWNYEILNDFSKFTQPLSSGIAPLFAWVSTILTIFAPNQIVAGKTVSLISGLILTTFLFKFLERAKIQNALPLTLIFAVLPINLVYNSLAILDSLMITFIFLAFGNIYLFLFENKRRASYSYPIFILLGLITKQITGLIVPAILVSYLVTCKMIDKKLMRVLVLSVISLLIFYLIFLPFKSKSQSILSDFIYVPRNISDSISFIKNNFWLTKFWLESYYPYTLLFSSMAGAVLSVLYFTKNKSFQFISITFAILVMLTVSLSAIYFPRYTLSFAPFVVVTSGIFVTQVAKKSKLLSRVILLAIVIETLFLASKLMINPQDSNVLAKEDRFQFYEDWTSGSQLPQIAAFLAYQAEQNPIIVWTEPASTLYTYGLPIYLKGNNIEIKKWEPDLEISRGNRRNYFIVNRQPASLPKGSYAEIKSFTLSQRQTVKILEKE